MRIRHSNNNNLTLKNLRETNATEKVAKNDSVNKEYVKTEILTDAKKKRHNKNGEFDKRNNYSYVPNTPRKFCKNYGSYNHFTYVCKSHVSKGLKFTCKSIVPLKDKDNPSHDIFDFFPCNVNVMSSYFNLRR